jgi:hypothetical protein
MLKFTEHNLERKRDLTRAHNANAQAKKAAAAKRTLLLQQQAGILLKIIVNEGFVIKTSLPNKCRIIQAGMHC